jgi:hypothetical protein
LGGAAGQPGGDREYDERDPDDAPKPPRTVRDVQEIATSKRSGVAIATAPAASAPTTSALPPLRGARAPIPGAA